MGCHCCTLSVSVSLSLSVSQMLIRSRGLLLICVGECAIFLQLRWDASPSVVVMLASRARLCFCTAFRLARPLVRGARARSREPKKPPVLRLGASGCCGCSACSLAGLLFLRARFSVLGASARVMAEPLELERVRPGMCEGTECEEGECGALLLRERIG